MQSKIKLISYRYLTEGSCLPSFSCLEITRTFQRLPGAPVVVDQELSSNHTINEGQPDNVPGYLVIVLLLGRTTNEYARQFLRNQCERYLHDLVGQV